MNTLPPTSRTLRVVRFLGHWLYECCWIYATLKVILWVHANHPNTENWIGLGVLVVAITGLLLSVRHHRKSL